MDNMPQANAGQASWLEHKPISYRHYQQWKYKKTIDADPAKQPAVAVWQFKFQWERG